MQLIAQEGTLATIAPIVEAIGSVVVAGAAVIVTVVIAGGQRRSERAAWSRDQLVEKYSAVSDALRAIYEFARKAARIDPGAEPDAAALDARLMAELDELRDRVQATVNAQLLVGRGRARAAIREAIELIPRGDFIPDRRRDITPAMRHRMQWSAHLVRVFDSYFLAAARADLRVPLGLSRGQARRYLKQIEREWREMLRERDRVKESTEAELISFLRGYAVIGGNSGENRVIASYLSEGLHEDVAALLHESDPPAPHDLMVNATLPPDERRVALRWALNLASANFRDDTPEATNFETYREYVFRRDEVRTFAEHPSIPARSSRGPRVWMEAVRDAGRHRR